jgi:hypothetical protein
MLNNNPYSQNTIPPTPPLPKQMVSTLYPPLRSSVLVKSMPEYEILYRWHNTNCSHDTRITLDLLSQTLGTYEVPAQRTLESINLNVIKQHMDDMITYLVLYQRFLALWNQLDAKLEYTNEAFVLDGHKFATLDEVERVIANRALL